MKKDEDSLTIINVSERDEGIYTCVASTELDSDSAKARLTVLVVPSTQITPLAAVLKDRPDPPRDLELTDPADRSIRLTWIPGDDNNSPITEFIVQFEENKFQPRKWHNLTRIPGSINSAVLQLSPYVNYQFRVIAVNEVGEGAPSLPSERYQTTGTAPELNPSDVRGAGISKSSMQISWTPLNGTQISGPNLKYIVSWRQKDVGGEWSTVTVPRSSYIVSPTPFFTPYEIKVQAVNDFGLGPEPRIVIGYSGEDFPIAAPTGLSGRIINSTAILLQWRALPPDSVQGYLIGHKIQYWNEGSLLKTNQYRSRVQVTESPSQRLRAIVSGLQPYHAYKFQVAAVNGRGRGPWSEEFAINTTEGVPGKPSYLRIRQPDLESITLQWGPPRDPNGILTGYVIMYHPLTGSRSRRNATIPRLGPDVTTYKLERVDANIKYRFYVFAQTRQGLGEAIVLDSPDFENEAFTNSHVDIATQGWFIGLMCAVALLVLILLIVCFIKRSRGGKYPVKTTEENRPSQDDNGYLSLESDNEDSKKPQGSQSSVDGTVKQEESDDSIVIYGDGDGNSRFGEDGSFIGQYTVKKDKEETEGNDSSEATSPVNPAYSLAQM